MCRADGSMLLLRISTGDSSGSSALQQRSIRCNRAERKGKVCQSEATAMTMLADAKLNAILRAAEETSNTTDAQHCMSALRDTIFDILIVLSAAACDMLFCRAAAAEGVLLQRDRERAGGCSSEIRSVLHMYVTLTSVYTSCCFDVS